MGTCQSLRERIHTRYAPINNDLLSLIMTDRTADCLEIMRANPRINYSEPINIFGDNLLHYVCKRNNTTLVEYIISVDKKAGTTLNKFQQFPVQLSSDPQIHKLLKT
jgi:hypothetical protein